MLEVMKNYEGKLDLGTLGKMKESVDRLISDIDITDRVLDSAKNHLRSLPATLSNLPIKDTQVGSYSSRSIIGYCYTDEAGDFQSFSIEIDYAGSIDKTQERKALANPKMKGFNEKLDTFRKRNQMVDFPAADRRSNKYGLFNIPFYHFNGSISTNTNIFENLQVPIYIGSSGEVIIGIFKVISSFPHYGSVHELKRGKEEYDIELIFNDVMDSLSVVPVGAYVYTDKLGIRYFKKEVNGGKPKIYADKNIPKREALESFLNYYANRSNQFEDMFFLAEEEDYNTFVSSDAVKDLAEYIKLGLKGISEDEYMKNVNNEMIDLAKDLYKSLMSGDPRKVFPNMSTYSYTKIFSQLKDRVGFSGSIDIDNIDNLFKRSDQEVIAYIKSNLENYVTMKVDFVDGVIMGICGNCGNEEVILEKDKINTCSCNEKYYFTDKYIYDVDNGMEGITRTFIYHSRIKDSEIGRIDKVNLNPLNITNEIFRNQRPIHDISFHLLDAVANQGNLAFADRIFTFYDGKPSIDLGKVTAAKDMQGRYRLLSLDYDKCSTTTILDNKMKINHYGENSNNYMARYRISNIEKLIDQELSEGLLVPLNPTFTKRIYDSMDKYGVIDDFLSLMSIEEGSLEHYAHMINYKGRFAGYYRVFPKIELLIKSNLQHVVKGLVEECLEIKDIKRLFNVNGKNPLAICRLNEDSVQGSKDEKFSLDFEDIKMINIMHYLSKYSKLEVGLISANGLRAMYNLLNYSSGSVKESHLRDLFKTIRDAFKELDIEERLKGLITVNEVFEYLWSCMEDQAMAYSDVVIYWRDYLRAAGDSGYNLSEKSALFPDSLKREHSVATYISERQLGEAKRKAFLEIVNKEDYKSLEGELGEYIFLRPKEAGDLVDEGSSLSHCVGSYVSQVSSGACKIIFLRKADSPKKSLCTLEIKGKSIVQARGSRNRLLNYAERDVVSQWAEANDLLLLC